ncbi:MAG: MFS transporter [Acidimicrobiia bacterium]
MSSGHPKRFRSLGRPFWTAWTAATASNIGDGIVLAALPLLAASITREPMAVAATTIAIRLPWLVFGLFAGVIVDRTDRLRLMIATDLGRAAAFAGIALIVATDNMTLLILYAAIFGVGVLETLFDTAAMSLTPSLVESDQLEHANARINGAQIAANEFVGPPVGAALFAIAAAVPFGVNAITFAVSVVVLLTVRGRFRPQRVERLSVVGDIRDGFGFLWREPVIRAFAIGAGVINLGFTAAVSVLVLHAQENLLLDEIGFGLLLASAAVGGVTGAQLAPRVIHRLGRKASVLTSVGAVAAGIAIMGVATGLPVAGAGFALFGFAAEIWNIVSVTYRQAATPDAMLGRVMSGFRVIAYGAFPIGAALGGLIASAVSLRAAFFVGAALVAALLPFLLYTTNRHSLEPTGTG